MYFLMEANLAVFCSLLRSMHTVSPSIALCAIVEIHNSYKNLSKCNSTLHPLANFDFMHVPPWCHTSNDSGTNSAQPNLDEAWEIAERGPMPLFMADTHLYRAGLFHQIQPYPWQSAAQDLQEARRLIEKHGYLRRLPFLQVVEEAITPRMAGHP